MTGGLSGDGASGRPGFFAAALTGAYACLIAVWPGTAGKILLALPLVLLPGLAWLLAQPTKLLAAYLPAALLLPPLPFALGNTGPHLSLAAALAGLAAGGLRIDEWRIQLDRLPLSILLFASALAASVPMALFYSGAAVAAGSLARVFLFGISVYVFFYARFGPGAGREDEFRLLRWLFAAGCATAFFACVDFYFQFPPPAGYGPQFIWLASGVYRRAQGVFYEASTLGNVCAFFLVMIAVSLLQPRDRRPFSRPVLFAGGAVLFAALVLSFSRSSLVNLAVSLIALLILERRRIHWRKLFAAAALAAATLVPLTFLALPRFAQLYWTRIFNSFRYFLESPNAILSGRLDTWAALVQAAADHPHYALFGIGYKTLPYSHLLGRTIIADNSYLSLPIETGVF